LNFYIDIPGQSFWMCYKDKVLTFKMTKIIFVLSLETLIING